MSNAIALPIRRLLRQGVVAVGVTVAVAVAVHGQADARAPRIDATVFARNTFAEALAGPARPKTPPPGSTGSTYRQEMRAHFAARRGDLEDPDAASAQRRGAASSSRR